MSEISMDKKVRVKNLCAWDLYFGRIESNGTVKLPAKGTTRLTVGEIEAQVNDNNVMFVGTDGEGSHARIYIDDKETRVFLGFESEELKESQQILDSETVKKIIEYKTQQTFEKHVKEKVKTKAEKNFIIEEAKRQKLNDFDKIKFLEEYTGFKFDN